MLEDFELYTNDNGLKLNLEKTKYSKTFQIYGKEGRNHPRIQIFGIYYHTLGRDYIRFKRSKGQSNEGLPKIERNP